MNIMLNILRNEVHWMLLLLLIMTSCDVTRSLPENTLLYSGATITLLDDSLNRKDHQQMSGQLERLLRPHPNTAILGYPYKLHLHQSLQPADKRWKQWMVNKWGEAPVLFSRVDAGYTQLLLLNSLENNGFFFAETQIDTLQNHKKVKINYSIRANRPYFLRKVNFPEDDSPIARAISSEKANSLLKPGDRYQLEVMKAERERIDAHLKNKGYYYFNPDYIIMQVDSTVGNYELDVYVRLKMDTPEQALHSYQVRNVIVVADYSPGNDLRPSAEGRDSLLELIIHDPDNLYKPSLFDRNVVFRPGMMYSRDAQHNSLHRLMALGEFRYVRNQLIKADTTSYLLDSYYYLTPGARNTFRAELTVKSNSANYNGSDVALQYARRNVFRSAGFFQSTLFGGLESQWSGNNNVYPVFRVGGEMELLIPDRLFPFEYVPSGGYMPSTRLTAGYELQARRQLYSRHLFNLSLGYQWKQHERGTHKVGLTDIVYTNPVYLSDLYKDYIQIDPALQKVVQRGLMFGPSYSFVYTNMMETFRAHRMFSRSSVQTSGVVTGLLTGASIQKPVAIAGVPFSQFVRLEQEYRHCYYLNNRTNLAGRVIVGAGYAFGNSESMPYVRRFFIGGTNSLRAFQARSVGPGTYRSPAGNDRFMPDESGDIKLELNAEVRTQLHQFVHSAVFVDAGNVWLLRETTLQPGAAISVDFLNELAIGVGAGLRFDFSVLVLRLDVAIPVRKPWLPTDERWVLNAIDFKSRVWRRENIVWNFALGYPF